MAHVKQPGKQAPGYPWRKGCWGNIPTADTLPDWYWRRGLHDARITAIRTDTAATGETVVILSLDSKNALWDTEIREIRLYTVGRQKPLPCMENWHALYWLSDTVTTADAYPTPLYRLEIRLCVQAEDMLYPVLHFTISRAEVIRNAATNARNNADFGGGHRL